MKLKLLGAIESCLIVTSVQLTNFSAVFSSSVILYRGGKLFMGSFLNFHRQNNSSKENDFSSWKPLNWVMVIADYLVGLLEQEEIKFHWTCY